MLVELTDGPNMLPLGGAIPAANCPISCAIRGRAAKDKSQRIVGMWVDGCFAWFHTDGAKQ